MVNVSGLQCSPRSPSTPITSGIVCRAFLLPSMALERDVRAGIGDAHAITEPAKGCSAHRAHADKVSATLCRAHCFIAGIPEAHASKRPTTKTAIDNCAESRRCRGVGWWVPVRILFGVATHFGRTYGGQREVEERCRLPVRHPRGLEVLGPHRYDVPIKIPPLTADPTPFGGVGGSTQTGQARFL